MTGPLTIEQRAANALEELRADVEGEISTSELWLTRLFAAAQGFADDPDKVEMIFDGRWGFVGFVIDGVQLELKKLEPYFGDESDQVKQSDGGPLTALVSGYFKGVPELADASQAGEAPERMATMVVDAAKRDGLLLMYEAVLDSILWSNDTLQCDDCDSGKGVLIDDNETTIAFECDSCGIGWAYTWQQKEA